MPYTQSVCVLGCLCFLACPLAAQFRGGIQGNVLDSSGGAIPDASVTCTSNETRRKITVSTDASGVYHCLQLGPGTYTVDATKTGFQETTSLVTVNAEAIQSANLTMQTGKLTQEVTVSADVSTPIETTNGDVTRAITTRKCCTFRRQVAILMNCCGFRLAFSEIRRGAGRGNQSAFPNSGREALPQAPADRFFFISGKNQVPISADGQRLTANNYLIDGVSVNSLQWGGAAVVTPNQESVKEIRVNANAYSAEYGRNSGAQIETVSQNGTDHFHGSALFLMQDPNFNAYNKPSIPSIPVTRVDNNFRNYAGAWVGPSRRIIYFSFSRLRGFTNTRPVFPLPMWRHRSLIKRF